MKTNSEQVLFEGTVMDAWEVTGTDPHSECINLNYSVTPYYLIEREWDEWGIEYQKNTKMDKGWVQITLPEFHGLKPGDKIKVVKV